VIYDEIRDRHEKFVIDQRISCSDCPDQMHRLGWVHFVCGMHPGALYIQCVYIEREGGERYNYHDTFLKLLYSSSSSYDKFTHSGFSLSYFALPEQLFKAKIQTNFHCQNKDYFSPEY
jgi:hypothetical protein